MYSKLSCFINNSKFLGLLVNNFAFENSKSLES